MKSTKRRILCVGRILPGVGESMKIDADLLAEMEKRRREASGD